MPFPPVARWLLVVLSLLGLPDCGPPNHHPWFDYPRLGIEGPIYRGWENTLNLGHITLLDDGPGGFFPPPPPGGVGTYWVGGHHTADGAPFRHLTGARVGDSVSVDGITYRVRNLYWNVNRFASLGPDLINQDTKRWLLLQTSLSYDTVLLVLAGR